jgi:hypothetical protein
MDDAGWLALRPADAAVPGTASELLREAAAQWSLSRAAPRVSGRNWELTRMEGGSERGPAAGRLRGEARALRDSGLVSSEQGMAFLTALGALLPPDRLPRSVFLRGADDGSVSATAAVSAQGVGSTAASWAGAVSQCETVTTYDYWDTVGGTPAAFVRAWELAAWARGSPTLGDPGRANGVIEFGYGSTGQLQALASLGYAPTGIETNRGLHALYSPDDNGVRLLWSETTGPLVQSLAAIEPGRASLFVSKNTLKKGYVNPEPPHDGVLALGVSDAQFLAAVLAALCPGGVCLIYNIHPSMEEQPYRSWADGRCPFTAGQCEVAGFDVVSHNADDTAFVVSMARALGWDGQMDVDADLFATFTLLRRPCGRL